jgi:hypothetical protein
MSSIARSMGHDGSAINLCRQKRELGSWVKNRRWERRQSMRQWPIGIVELIALCAQCAESKRIEITATAGR